MPTGQRGQKPVRVKGYRRSPPKMILDTIISSFEQKADPETLRSLFQVLDGGKPEKQGKNSEPDPE